MSEKNVSGQVDRGIYNGIKTTLCYDRSRPFLDESRKGWFADKSI
jgi:hypothetical protein